MPRRSFLEILIAGAGPDCGVDVQRGAGGGCDGEHASSADAGDAGVCVSRGFRKQSRDDAGWSVVGVAAAGPDGNREPDGSYRDCRLMPRTRRDITRMQRWLR